MIFGADLLHLIVEGRKTQTRRPVKPGEDRCRYRVGRDYAAQPGRGRPAVCRVEVLDVRCEPVGEISERDAEREGFESPAKFLDRWRELYGEQTDMARLVWVISFRPVFDQPRLLRARPSAAKGAEDDAEHGYTHQPALAIDPADEPEAVDPHTQQRFTDSAEQDRLQGDLARRSRSLRDLDQRLARARNGPERARILFEAAEREGVQLDSTLRVLRAKIAKRTARAS